MNKKEFLFFLLFGKSLEFQELRNSSMKVANAIMYQSLYLVALWKSGAELVLDYLCREHEKRKDSFEIS